MQHLHIVNTIHLLNLSHILLQMYKKKYNEVGFYLIRRNLYFYNFYLYKIKR